MLRMTPGVFLVLVEHGQARERAALGLLIPALQRVFPGANVRTVVVDNARAGEPDRAIDRTCDRVSGDNTLHEFSGWDRGLAWLDARCELKPESIVVLANDTVARADKRGWVQSLTADRARAAADGALVGWVEEYPREVEIFGLPLRHFIDTSLVIAQRRTFAALGPFARRPADGTFDDVFADDWHHFFREPSPLSENYRVYLRTYFFGERIDSDFDQRWYAHESIAGHNFDAFKAKLRCVFCEHLLSARARQLGIPLVDIRQHQPVIAAHPRVSVIIPCYNLGAYLDEAVESVLAQTCQDFEIVIVDDGSIDPGTQALLADYQRPKTRVIRIAHAGVSEARNVAIAHSTGAYLCALDADDRLEPTYLEKALRVLGQDPSLTFVSCWARLFGDEAWDWQPERCDLPALLCEDTVCTAALVRRDAVLAVGGFDTQIPIQGAEDWELWLTLVERGYRGVILREVLFNYRRRPGSLSTVSWYGSGHVPLTNYRLARHSESYRAHLSGVLLYQDTETAGYLRRNDELERYIGTELEPFVAAQHEELARLCARLSAATTTADAGAPAAEDSAKNDAAISRITELEATLHMVAAEALALRSSMSWRVTAPLRDVYGWWLRRRGQA
ncbi:MAG: glycosyltransferase [Acidobacteria bacterium]|nr:glycosyltransferase [Acidobacteriota bacterium]